MLGFFRKYQKFFFIIVAVSFVFFGTYSTLGRGPKETPDREVGKLIDGSPLMEKELAALTRLLKYGVEEGGRNYNFLNDSLIHREIILSGIGEVVAMRYFPLIEGELQERWRRAKRYTPYSHPEASHISARAAWDQFAPKINVLLDELKEAPEEFSKEQLPLLFQLYAAQAEFPAPLLHQLLYNEQAQSEQVSPDPAFNNAEMGLFGFYSVEDWFGAKYENLLVKVILNGSIIAAEKGYEVSREEAWQDLFSNVYNTLKAYSKEENISGEQAQNSMLEQMRYFGFTEDLAASLWQKVMLFRRMVGEAGAAVFIDSLALDQFKNFSKPSVKVCRYELPKALQFSNMRSLFKFQRYLEIVSEVDVLDLPTTFRSANEIQMEHPELAYKVFQIEVASISRNELEAGISLKKTWDWEIDQKNFARLQEAFSSLSSVSAQSEEERVAALEELSEQKRFAVDQFARTAILNDHLEWIDEALATKEHREVSLKVRAKGGATSFDGEEFIGWLESDDPALARYSPHDENFFSIHVLEKGKNWELLTFEQVNMDQTMENALDQLLIAAYSSFDMTAPFEEMQDEVAERVYADLLNEIDLHAVGEISEEGLAPHRFDRLLQEMHHLVLTDKEGFAKAQESPWALKQYEENLVGREIALDIGEFSTVSTTGFYQVLEKGEVGASEEEIAAAKEHLARDAKKSLVVNLMAQLEEVIE
ncbi:MAG: hypothetical protein KR126chlam1_00227 [Chlamydiae bacterium]|nr:hypothetical protein [Chlamydiota bacterium]